MTNSPETEFDTIDTRSSERIDLAGKYLTFKLENEEFGIEIIKVREIMGLMDVTAVPRTPPEM